MLQPIRQPEVNPAFNLSKIQLTDFRLENVSLETAPGFSADQIETFDTLPTFKFWVFEEENLLETVLTLEVSVQPQPDTALTAHAIFQMHFMFYVENLNDLIEKSNDEIIIDPALLNVCVSTSYSTARGILITRLQGTVLRNHILPIADVFQLMEKS